MTSENVEVQWFELLLQDNEAALRYFLKASFPAVRGYVYTFVKHEAEADDISRSVFLKLWEKRKTLKSLGHLQGFLYLTARNDAISYLRKQQTLSIQQRQYLDLYTAEESEDALTIRDAELLKAMVLQTAYQRAATLPPACRQVFDMHFQDGKKVEEIARLLRLSPSTVYNQLQKAIAAMRKTLKEKRLLD